MKAEHDSYKSRFEDQQELTGKLHQQMLDIQQKHEQFIRELEKRYAERLRNAVPDWEYISKRSDGNIEAFWSPCGGLNCNETIVKLISMCAKGKVTVAASNLDSKGNLKNTSGRSNVSLEGFEGYSDGFSLRKKRDAEETETFFMGRGSSHNVPRYLRFNFSSSI